MATIGLSSAGLAGLALGAMLWMRFGELVYFDQLMAGLAGCLF